MYSSEIHKEVEANIAGSSICTSHDDDDGRGRPVQDKVETPLEKSHLRGPRQEDQGPHGRQGGPEENPARRHGFLYIG